MITKRRLMRTIGGVAGLAVFSGLPPSSADANSDRRKFWVPEEARPHLRTFMQWPVSRVVYRDPVFLDMLQQAVADIANAVSEFEPVVMLMDAKHERKARQKLGAAVETWNIPTDDLWCRDAGPVFVKDRSGVLAVSHLNFNGWGNKQAHPNDGKIAERVAGRLGLSMHDNGLVGEGGGVESDGDGTLIAHESSWVNDNRNKGSKAEVERLLLAAIGGEKIIWAPGIKGADITDYHIDSLARFIEPGTILIQLPERAYPDDPWSVSAFETYDILKSSTDAKGNLLKLVVVPEPYDTRIQSADFVASYVNYYVCNGAVIAAQFGDNDIDQEAGRILASLYPDREIVRLNVDPVGETGGGVHCTTQQQPAV